MKEFEDLEGDVHLEKFKGTPIDLPKVNVPMGVPKKTKAPKFTEEEKKVISLYPEYNENQIASILMIPLHQVKEILDR